MGSEDLVLGDDLVAWLDQRAERAGRDVTEQLVYEVGLNRGQVAPDPWDTEGTERAKVLRLILPSSRYQLKTPLMG
jgi:hypothetical protein